MGITSSDRLRCAGIGAAAARAQAWQIAPGRAWAAARMLLIAATASLATCAQPAVFAEKPDTEVVTAQAPEPEAKPAPGHKPKPTPVAKDRAPAPTSKPSAEAEKPDTEVVTARAPEPEAKPAPGRKPKPTPAAKDRAPAPTSKPSAEKKHTTYYGSASYYSHHTRTASGERFNPRELTAAHRTLPFGTRVRVTELTSGRSVTVRINDRGPFIAGRIVDVSKSAAEELGMVGRGIARVKLDVVDD
jgi:rare lipoprotein A